MKDIGFEVLKGRGLKPNMLLLVAWQEHYARALGVGAPTLMAVSHITSSLMPSRWLLVLKWSGLSEADIPLALDVTTVAVTWDVAERWLKSVLVAGPIAFVVRCWRLHLTV